MTIKAIETKYAGCRFRSRLEARWAVFFDHLGITWEYEPQGFEVGPQQDRRGYLPDFWLPADRIWVEVKGDRGDADLRKIAYAADANYGLPGGPGRRMILLGNVPRVDRQSFAWHHVVTFKDDNLTQLLFRFNASGIDWMNDPPGLPLGSASDDYEQLNAGPSFWQFDAFTHVADPFSNEHRMTGGASVKVVGAYTAARSARFEHGERG